MNNYKKMNNTTEIPTTEAEITKSRYEKYFKDRFHNDPEFRQRRYDAVNKYVRARKLVDPEFKNMFNEASKKYYRENEEQRKKTIEQSKERSKKYYQENEEYRKKKIESAKKRYYDNKIKKQHEQVSQGVSS